MKGFKGFGPGLVCKGKRYAENTVFEEEKAVVCENGMHFCENPFEVLNYYSFVNNNAEINEFAEVEALDETHTNDNSKFCTKKLRIGARIGIAGLVKAFVDFTVSKVDFKNAPATNTGYMSAATNTGYMSAATNTGNMSAATNTGNMSAATNTGDRSAATNTGYMSAAKVEGEESVAIATGYESKVSGKIGCWLVATERDNEGHILSVRAVVVDGEQIKEDVWYKLVDGEFVEADE